MSEENKPRRSMLSNLFWCLHRLCAFAPYGLIGFALLIPVNIALEYLSVYLPALAVAEVTSGSAAAAALERVGWVMGGLMLLALFKAALELIKSRAIGIYRGQCAALHMRKALTMFYQDYEKKDTRDLADRALRATQQWNGVQPLTDILDAGFGVLENVAGYLTFGAVVSLVSVWLIPLLTVPPVLSWLAARAYNRWSHGADEKTRPIEARLDYVIARGRSFSAAKDIRVYGMAGWLRACRDDLTRELRGWDGRRALRMFLSRLADLVLILVRDAGAYALLIVFFVRGEITVDQFVLYFAAVASFASWVGAFIDSLTKWHRVSLSISDLRAFLDWPEHDGAGEARADDHMKGAPEIEFDHVSFRYDGAETDTLHDLSFTLHSGEKLALVGLNGAGKTTLVKLMCGLYAPTSGTIKLNGVPVSKFRRRDYYRLFSPVFQTVRTAFFTIAEHVSAQPLAQTDLKRVGDCLRMAGLGEKVAALPKGALTPLDKQVDAQATELSGGEAQKLMLARALYKDAPVLLLDEPTAALDPIAEKNVYQAYEAMTRGKSSLFISHRLASTAFCDRVLYLENGRIAEEGSHAALIRAGGKYKRLFDIQSCWYQEGEGEGA